MTRPSRGRLLQGSTAPESGEHVEQLVQVGEVVIEQILSGVLDESVDYDQDHDEWVVLLEGSAELEVSGERLVLEPGDWVLLLQRRLTASYGPHGRQPACRPPRSWRFSGLLPLVISGACSLS
jgi:hypothetical protein